MLSYLWRRKAQLYIIALLLLLLLFLKTNAIQLEDDRAQLKTTTWLAYVLSGYLYTYFRHASNGETLNNVYICMSKLAN